jgi:hypothetical protein
MQYRYRMKNTGNKSGRRVAISSGKPPLLSIFKIKETDCKTCSYLLTVSLSNQFYAIRS